MRFKATLKNSLDSTKKTYFVDAHTWTEASFQFEVMLSSDTRFNLTWLIEKIEVINVA